MTGPLAAGGWGPIAKGGGQSRSVRLRTEATLLPRLAAFGNFQFLTGSCHSSLHMCTFPSYRVVKIFGAPLSRKSVGNIYYSPFEQQAESVRLLHCYCGPSTSATTTRLALSASNFLPTTSSSNRSYIGSDICRDTRDFHITPYSKHKLLSSPPFTTYQAQDEAKVRSSWPRTSLWGKHSAQGNQIENSELAPKKPEKREGWQSQKEALKNKFQHTGWLPRKRLSPDALEGIRAIYARYPNKYTTPVLAEKFKVSPEAIRRILKSKWRPDEKEEKRRQERWNTRGERIWNQMADIGLHPPKRWRNLRVQILNRRRRDTYPGTD